MDAEGYENPNHIEEFKPCRKKGISFGIRRVSSGKWWNEVNPSLIGIV